MTSTKKFFTFSQKEISIVSLHASRKKYVHGLKIIQLPFTKLTTVTTTLTPPSHGKLLIVTPRKAGNAVERNRIRRRIKALFYQEQLYQHLCYTTIFVNPQAMKLSFQDLKDILLNLFIHKEHA